VEGGDRGARREVLQRRRRRRVVVVGRVVRPDRRRSRGRWRRALREGTKTRGRRRRRRDEADDDDGGESYAQVVYRQRSSYRTTDPQTYDEANVAMEPFLSREDRASYNSSLRDLSSHYDPVESVGVRLAPPPDELAAVAEEVEVENGGGDDDDAVKLSKMLARRRHRGQEDNRPQGRDGRSRRGDGPPPERQHPPVT
jgi:hypothetical protein